MRRPLLNFSSNATMKLDKDAKMSFWHQRNNNTSEVPLLTCKKASTQMLKVSLNPPLSRLIQIKKSTCLTRTQIKTFRDFWEQVIKLDIFVNFPKKTHFWHFRTPIIFFGFILQFWRSAILLSQTLYIFFQVAFCNKSDIGQEPSNHTSLLY